MRSKILLFLFMAMSFSAFAQKQNGYKKVYKLNEYNKDWALVKTVSGTYGFVDKNGKVIVQPIYSKIEKFGEYNKDWALIKSISDAYGFIDKTGKVIVDPIYAKIEKFGEYNADLALVKSTSDAYGFIDKNGKVIVPATYKLDDIKKNFKEIYKKHNAK